MTELLLGRLSPGRLSVGVAAGVITLVVILVVVAMALPFGCASGLSWDGACAVKTVSPGKAALPPKARPAVAAPTQKPVSTGPQAPAVARPLQNLVAATFQTLHVPSGPVAVAGGVAMPAQTKPQPDETMAKSADLGSGVGPETRKVKTIAIGPDQAMHEMAPSTSGSEAAPNAQAAPLQAVASAPQATAAAPVQLAPAADTVAPPAAETPVPLAPPPARSSVAPKAAGKAVPKAARKAARVEAAPTAAAPTAAAPAATAPAATAPNALSALVVVGSGVTVRSGPAKANGKLFPLGAGQQVTVIGSQKGWLHITDAQGRVGWAYSAYFSKSGK